MNSNSERRLALKKFRIIFMGGPEFSVPSLETIYKHEHLVAVVTGLDKPKGRGLQVTPPPVKSKALSWNVPIFQPQKIRQKDFHQKLRDLKPDFIIVAAYGKILPKTILEIPRHGCLNVHASLLPKYRGAAPINWAIICGEKETGVTIFKMDEKIDTGDILFMAKTQIGNEETAEELGKRLSILGAESLKKTLSFFRQGAIKPIPQEHQKATFAPRLRREDGKVKWSEGAKKIHNHIRGVYPWPGAFTTFKNKYLKIHRAKIKDISSKTKPGEIIDIDQEGIIVGCKQGAIILQEIQLEGKRKILARQFIQGYNVSKGMILGN
jgi:methionyl-tRNA formyltransferase